MWKLLLKCHQKQFQAILESKTRALKANAGLRRDSSVRATIQLEAELLKWCRCFHHWIEMQRSYAETLNDWLEKCLLYEPEITADGEVPYSPGRIGAPLVFITCHDWKQAMERISESAVQTAMHDFATSLHQLWERQDEEQRCRLAAENTYKDFEKQIWALKMERQGRGHDTSLSDNNSLSMVGSKSGMSALNDLKLDLDTVKQRVKDERAGHKEAMKLVHDAVSRSIQAGLVPIFKALESFTSEACTAFDEVRLEHDRGY
uniref:DNA-directed RNA polymerase n=1 Tax=Opuntia streptacantha TaxID=393608 RepID=A0A7C8YMY5_OPUST